MGLGHSGAEVKSSDLRRLVLKGGAEPDKEMCGGGEMV